MDKIELGIIDLKLLKKLVEVQKERRFQDGEYALFMVKMKGDRIGLKFCPLNDDVWEGEKREKVLTHTDFLIEIKSTSRHYNKLVNILALKELDPT